MTELYPWHFALSEALVALAGAYAMWRLARTEWLAALGLFPFALAGLIGAIQISAGLGEPVTGIHRFVSHASASFGLCCLIGGLWRRNDWLAPIAGLAAMIATVVVPQLGLALAAVLVVVGAWLTWLRAPRYAVGFALPLIVQLAVAPLRAPHPAIAWNLFHVAVTVWMLLVVAILQPGRQNP